MLQTKIFISTPSLISVCLYIGCLCPGFEGNCRSKDIEQVKPFIVYIKKKRYSIRNDEFLNVENIFIIFRIIPCLTREITNDRNLTYFLI